MVEIVPTIHTFPGKNANFNMPIPPRLGLVLLALLYSLSTASAQAQQSEKMVPMTGQGIMVGEVSDTSAIVQVRLTKTDELVDRDLPGTPGRVQFILRSDSRGSTKASVTAAAAKAEKDFIARAVFKGLRPGTRYICRTFIGPDDKTSNPGPVARFRTLPGEDSSAPVRFVVVTGMNYAKFHGDDRIDRKEHLVENNTELPPPYQGEDKHLGYPALETIRKLRPHFFVGTGDNVYYDTPSKPRAKTAPEMRQKWHEQFVQPRYRQLFAEVPTYWMVDDHDYRYDDCDNTGDEAPSPELGQRILLEQLPYAAHNDKDAKTYRTYRVNRDLQVWFPENRFYRSPNAMEDGPEKSIWGPEQKIWLKQTLKASDATFKLLISPTPMIGPDDLRKKDNHTNIGGFRHERDEFFTWLKENELDKNFAIVCGDRHWQYHSVSPEGFEEFSSGALVDANSRLGRQPGDPKSTDPEGKIKQPYMQNPASGGFLMIDIQPARATLPATLTFSFRDEAGKVLYVHQKVAEQEEEEE